MCMICKKNSNTMTVPNHNDNLLSECLMNVTIFTASVIASVIIGDSTISYMKNGSKDVNYTLLLIAIIMLGCCIRCIVEVCILTPYAERKHQDTLECAKRVHAMNNNQLVKFFVIEGCPEVKGLELQEKGGVCLRGKYTTRYVQFGQDGATITSRKKDRRAKLEANAIMRVLVKASN